MKAIIKHGKDSEHIETFKIPGEPEKVYSEVSHVLRVFIEYGDIIFGLTYEDDTEREFRFKVGEVYKHKIGKEKITSMFVCTKREGNVVTLEEIGGDRVFTGEVSKADIYHGFNECLKIGVIHCDGFDLIDSIGAKNFLEVE